MDFQEFIKPEFLILVPVLYAIGAFFKISALKDKYIPLLLGIISIVLCVVYILSTSTLATVQDVLAAVFLAITQGILAAAAAVFTNQLFKQASKKE